MINENENIIVVVGAPAAGKTALTEQLAAEYPDYVIIHTDDYIKYGFEDSIYRILDDVARMPDKKIIIEGIQSARILRKGLERNSLFADLIIKVEAPDDVLQERYYARNQKPYPFQTKKMIQTVFNDYLQKSGGRSRIITYSGKK